MEHLTLTVFSICVQAAIGIMAFVAVGRLMNPEGVFSKAMIAAAAFGIIGVLASLLHLGRPLGAIKALYQFGSSWLSREIWFTTIFLGLTLLAVVFVYFRPQSKSTITGFATAAAIVGLVDVYFMAAIYNMTSVFVWHGVATFVEFYLAAISMGAVIVLFLNTEEVGNLKKLIPVIVAVAVTLQVVAVEYNLIMLGGSSSKAVQISLTLLSGMVLATVFKWASIFAGAVLILWVAKKELSRSYTNTILGSAVLILAGQAAGRYVFYAVIVVTRVGLT